MFSITRLEAQEQAKRAAEAQAKAAAEKKAKLDALKEQIAPCVTKVDANAELKTASEALAEKVKECVAVGVKVRTEAGASTTNVFAKLDADAQAELRQCRDELEALRERVKGLAAQQSAALREACGNAFRPTLVCLKRRAAQLAVKFDGLPCNIDAVAALRASADRFRAAVDAFCEKNEEKCAQVKAMAESAKATLTSLEADADSEIVSDEACGLRAFVKFSFAAKAPADEDAEQGDDKRDTNDPVVKLVKEALVQEDPTVTEDDVEVVEEEPSADGDDQVEYELIDERAAEPIDGVDNVNVPPEENQPNGPVMDTPLSASATFLSAFAAIAAFASTW